METVILKNGAEEVKDPEQLELDLFQKFEFDRSLLCMPFLHTKFIMLVVPDSREEIFVL